MQADSRKYDDTFNFNIRAWTIKKNCLTVWLASIVSCFRCQDLWFGVPIL